MIQRPVGAFGYNVGNGGLSRTGGAIKNQIGGHAAFDDAAKHGAGTQQVLLTGHLIQTLRTDFICQRLHLLPPFLQNDLL